MFGCLRSESVCFDFARFLLCCWGSDMIIASEFDCFQSLRDGEFQRFRTGSRGDELVK